MEGEGLLLGSNVPQENGANGHCCNGRCGSTTQAKPVAVQPAPNTNKRCRSCSTATYDSGFGVSLNTISEHQERCDQGCGKPYSDITDNSKRESINEVPCSLHWSCNAPAPTCDESLRCQNHGQIELSPNGNGVYMMNSHSMKGVRISRSSGDFQVSKQNANCKRDRRRAVSESCAGNYNSNPMLPNQVFYRNSDTYSEKDVESTDSTEKIGRCRRNCCKIVIAIAFLILLAGGIGTAFYFVTTDMHDEIENLKYLVEQEKTSRSSSSYTAGGNDRPRPQVHMSLSGRQQPLLKWDQRILQWNPRLKESDGFEYNNATRCLVVKEEGVYFVYNQIYVFREVAAESADVTQHTIFHTILRTPHNAPSKLEPLIIAESALSNCWDEQAQNQIHTSYQGIIVSLQQNDNLFVGLEGLGDSDHLESKSTFFGAFKL